MSSKLVPKNYQNACPHIEAEAVEEMALLREEGGWEPGKRLNKSACQNRAKAAV